MLEKLEAARQRLPASAAFSGLTAAWLHGLDVTPCNPIEATVPYDAGVSGRAGMALRRGRMDEVTTIHGFRVTSVPTTLVDLCRRLSLVEAVVIADAATNKRLISVPLLESWVSRHAGRHGIKKLRRVVELIEPKAESPMETRLRMVLVLGGLPRPKAQVPIKNQAGRFVGRPDLFYEGSRLAIEYDGAVHRDHLVDDNRRQNALLSAGVRLLRFTASDVLGKPESVVAQVRGMLTTEFAGKSVRSKPPTPEFAGKIVA